MFIAVAGVPAPAHAAPTGPGGSIEGTLTTAKGVPVAGILLQVTSPVIKSDQLPQTWTDESGHYSLAPLPAGRYRIGFYFPETMSTQWVPRKERESQAAWFTVRDGETTTVDESLFPTGALAVTLTGGDGGPVQAFCADAIGSLFLRTGCTTTGVLLLSELPVGTYLLMVSEGGGPAWAEVTEDVTTPIEVPQSI
jgi:hypothetical protein